MDKRKISRKEFVTKTLTGVAGITLISKNASGFMQVGLPSRRVGNTDIHVTPVGFGAPRTNDESLIRYALEKGINFIDTGRSYGNGNNEKMVGRAVSGRRQTVVIQSKIRLEADEVPSMGKGRKGATEIRSALLSKLEASLTALNTSYIDILLYHDASEESLLFNSATMNFFSDMKSKGLIKAHGFSTHNDRMNLLERNLTEQSYNVVMVPFNHKGSFVHSVTGNYSEWDHPRLISLLEKSTEKGIGVIAMKTCSGGKYSGVQGVQGSFPEAVKWVIQKKYICSAAIAMASFEQVDEYLPLLEVKES